MLYVKSICSSLHGRALLQRQSGHGLPTVACSLYYLRRSYYFCQSRSEHFNGRALPPGFTAPPPPVKVFSGSKRIPSTFTSSDIAVRRDSNEMLVVELCAHLPDDGSWIAVDQMNKKLKQKCMQELKQQWGSLARFCEHFPLYFDVHGNRHYIRRGQGNTINAGNLSSSASKTPPMMKFITNQSGTAYSAVPDPHSPKAHSSDKPKSPLIIKPGSKQKPVPNQKYVPKSFLSTK